MSDQSSSASVLPVKLWTPRVIMFTTLFVGFPSGIALASINWMRMGMMNKAIVHLTGGAIGALIFIILSLLLPGNVGGGIGILANVGILTYLRIQMKNDIEKFKAANRVVQNSSWLIGFLIGLGVFALYLALVFGVTVALTIVGVPIPE